MGPPFDRTAWAARGPSFLQLVTKNSYLQQQFVIQSGQDTCWSHRNSFQHETLETAWTLLGSTQSVLAVRTHDWGREHICSRPHGNGPSTREKYVERWFERLGQITLG